MSPSSEIRVLHVVPQFDPGGVSKVISNLVDGDGDEFHSSLAYGRGEWVRRLRADTFSVPLHPSTAAHAAQSFFRLRRIIRGQRVDVVHSHHRFASLVGHAAARSAGVSFVCSVHDMTHGNRALTRTALGRDVMVYSDAVQHHVEHYFRTRPEYVRRITMGVALPERDLHDDAAAFRSEWKIPADAKVIAFAGRLDFEKGPDLLLDAMPLILQASPNAVVCFAGDGPMRAELERSSLVLAGEGPVRFLGWCEQIDDLLAAADVVVVPSRSEGFGLTALEAMLRGRAVAASPVGGLPLLIQDGRTGVLFPNLTPESLAEGVSGVLKDGTLAARLGDAAREATQAAYSVAAMVTATHQVYRDAVRRLPARATSASRL